MANEIDHKRRQFVWASMGICLLYMQTTERLLAFALQTALQDFSLTPEKLATQSLAEERQTLHDFITVMRKRAKIDREFTDKLYRFKRMRNTFVHNIREIPGANWDTNEGIAAIGDHVWELLLLGLEISAVCTAAFSLSGKDDFGVDFFEQEDPELRKLIAIFEEKFGSTARKILATRVTKPERGEAD